jgi:hypothetical protein
MGDNFDKFKRKKQKRVEEGDSDTIATAVITKDPVPPSTQVTGAVGAIALPVIAAPVSPMKNFPNVLPA